MESQVSLGCEPCLHPEKILIKDVSSAEKKQTLQWAAWTRQEEESFFTALRQVGKAFFADMGGNVGHLHKLQGIESSSQIFT
ncbi:hypothetical protein CsSME_00035826 [Camellia sinensis var. sinensis]